MVLLVMVGAECKSAPLSHLLVAVVVVDLSLVEAVVLVLLDLRHVHKMIHQVVQVVQVGLLVSVNQT